MAKFVLTIKLGNAEMETGRDVADALRKVAHRIEDNALPLGDVDAIMDMNGNNVGSWEVKPDGV